MAAFTFKQRIEVRDSDAFMAAVSNVKADGQVRTFIPVLAQLVESWEYAGNPSDPAAYDDLDLFREYLPMVKAAESFIAETMGNG